MSLHPNFPALGSPFLMGTGISEKVKILRRGEKGYYQK
jgi:hypothetical protein